MEIKFHLTFCSGNFIYGLGLLAIGDNSLHPQKIHVLDKFASKLSNIRIT
jgi:hypothetical protein